MYKRQAAPHRELRKRLLHFIRKVGGIAENQRLAVPLEKQLDVYKRQPLEIPLLSKIPVIGDAFFSHNILIYLGIVISIAIWWYLKYTKQGLRLRAIGENPAAADAVGVNITLYKYVHIMLGSGIMGIGGLLMCINLSGSFEGSNCWVNGYGWISIALVIFANWNTLLAILGTFVFGLFNTCLLYTSIRTTS